MATKIKVIIADDAIFVLEGLNNILKDFGDIEIVALASTTQEVLKLAAQLKPDVIVLDIRWYTNKYAGIKLIKQLRYLSPKSSLIAMTAYENLLEQAEAAGAKFLLSKISPIDEIVDTIREAGSIKKLDLNRIKVLFLSADPTDLSRLRLEEELREIQEKLQLAKLRDRFQLIPRMAVRPADIAQSLLDIQPNIVHFSGHGSNTGILLFEDKLGKKIPVEPGALAALFKQFSNEVDCVILNACFSENQANAIAEHIDYVIGMNRDIGDAAAIAFSIGFYQALGAGRSIEQAFNLGIVQIRLHNIHEHLTPILINKEIPNSE